MKKTAALFALLGIGLAGCGGAATKSPTTAASGVVASTTPTTLSMADLGKRYEAAAGPVNAAVATFNSQYSKLGPSASAAAAGDVAEPLARVFEAADRALLDIPWPDRLHQEATAVVAADGILIAALNGVRGQPGFNPGTFLQQVGHDLGRGHAAVKTLRADLGLPPATG